MASQVYKTLARIVGIVLILAGIGAFAGGKFADSFIASQLEEQNITLPTEEAIASQLEVGRLDQEDADALRPYAGVSVTTGKHAYLFANHYIHAHLEAAVVRAGLDPKTATFATVGGIINEKKAGLRDDIKAANPSLDDDTVAKMAEAEIMNPLSEYPAALEVASLNDLRYDTLLQGNTLRGMLLNAYGWGLLGTIAKFAGIALAVVGLALTVWGFINKREREVVVA